MLELFGTKVGIIATVFIAQAVPAVLPAEIGPLVNIGAIGSVLAWFMIRLEPRMRKQEEAMDRQTRMNGYVIIAMKSVSPAIKEQVEAIIKETEDAERARTGK